MTSTYRVDKLLEQEDLFKYIVENSSIKLDTESSQLLVGAICSVLGGIDRFNHEEDLEQWMLDISTTDDEGIEVMIYHEKLDLITLLLEDDDVYDEEEILDAFGVDTFYTPKYQEFLKDEKLKKMLLKELRYWEMDSNFHTFGIDHVKLLLKKGFDLSPFGGRDDIDVEFSFDEEEIFVGCIDDEFETSSANPDYNLPHSQFDPEHPEESMELGIQSWSEFAEEDDSWEDLEDEEEWPEDDDFEADWDSEAEDEWDPGFEEETKD